MENCGRADSLQNEKHCFPTVFCIWKLLFICRGEPCSPIETIVKSVRLNTNYVFIAVSINNKILMCNFIRFGFATKTIGEHGSPLRIVSCLHTKQIAVTDRRYGLTITL